MGNEFLEPDKNGIVSIKEWYCNTIRFTHTLSKYKGQNTYKAVGKGDKVILHFGLKGNYNINYPRMDKSYELVGGHHNILYSDPFEMEFWNKTPEIETFGIQFPTQLFVSYIENASDELKRFSEKILKGEGAVLSEKWGVIDLSIQIVINQILTCQYNDGLKMLFLLSKSIELVVLCAESYIAAENHNTQLIKNPSDKEKIIAIRDLINNRLQSPPNLSEISREIGLNEYKVKRGFKEIFGTTIFNYLTDQRLSLARQHLLESSKNVAEVAYEFGYATPQHFNNAFRKKFGTTPNMIRKNP